MNSESIGRATLVPLLGPNTFIVCFECLKVHASKHLVSDTVSRWGDKVEFYISSSGTFGRGMAHVCNELRLKLHVVTESQLESSLVHYLEIMGANVYVPPLAKGSEQAGRLGFLKELVSRHDDSETRPVLIDQYSNPAIANGYRVCGSDIARTILRRMPNTSKIFLHGPVGSGGSTQGLAEGIRSTGVSVELYGCDHLESVNFADVFAFQSNGELNRRVRGIGSSVVIHDLCSSSFRGIVKASDHALVCASRCLLRESGAFVGPTTGGSLLAFLAFGANMVQSPTNVHLLLSPDSGWRYLASIFGSGSFTDEASLVGVKRLLEEECEVALLP